MKLHRTLLNAIKNPSFVLTKIYKLLIEKKNSDMKARADFLDFLSINFDVDAKALYSEHLNSEFKSWYDSKRFELVKTVGISSGASYTFDCETLFLLVRALKPCIVVETGVLYGASSSHILEALKENGTGKLYSIDLPNDQKLPKDFLIRESALDKWELIIGDSRVVLPKLLKKLKRINLFFHDSLHEFDHMLWEYQTALKYLSPNDVLTSHDVVSLPFKKNAFPVFCEKHHLDYWIFRNIGISFIS